MGTPPPVSLTVAVKVTDSPEVDGLSEEVTAVVVDTGGGSMNSPLRTAFAPVSSVIVITTLPLTCQLSYTPEWNDDTVSVSSTAPVEALLIWTCSLRAVLSQSRK